MNPNDKYSFMERDYELLTKQVLNSFDSAYKCFMEYSNNTTEMLNLRNMELREEHFHRLVNISENLSNLLSEINSRVQQVQKIRSDEITRIDSFINKLKGSPQQAWTRVVSRRAYQNMNKAMVIKKPPSPPPSDDITKIYINGNHYLSAIKVSDWNHVKNDGKLYYVDHADHFAIRVAGILFHGNIGMIYTNEKDPVKIKNCRFRETCSKINCNYYHDPLVHPGSKDKRNFIASSWLYAPPTSPFKNKRRSRRFGSVENLEVDILGLTPEETDRYIDQTMHDILCSILLHKYYHAQNSDDMSLAIANDQ